MQRVRSRWWRGGGSEVQVSRAHTFVGLIQVGFKKCTARTIAVRQPLHPFHIVLALALHLMQIQRRQSPAVAAHPPTSCLVLVQHDCLVRAVPCNANAVVAAVVAILQVVVPVLGHPTRPMHGAHDRPHLVTGSAGEQHQPSARRRRVGRTHHGSGCVGIPAEAHRSDDAISRVSPIARHCRYR